MATATGNTTSPSATWSAPTCSTCWRLSALQLGGDASVAGCTDWDWPVMMALTAGLCVVAFGFRGEGRINRIEGSLLLVAFAAYNTWLVTSVIGA
ncbi:MAG: hypothetical protein U5K56_05170 [Halioglobus sp.]|nr:hypothetical protein [Halioglobus sp.]